MYVQTVIGLKSVIFTRPEGSRVEVLTPFFFCLFVCLCKLMVVSRADVRASWCARNRENNDLNFSARAHSSTNIYPGKKPTIVVLNALVETLLLKLGDSALYVLFGSYRKTERIQLLAPCYFQTQQALQFTFSLSPQMRISTR